MSQAAGKTHNLDDDGGDESLRALIRSIVPDATTNSNGKYSADIVDTLTQKLSEMLGPDAFPDHAPGEGAHTRRNDKGELVNEEGLPIIDITENAEATQFQYTDSRPAPITVEPLLPLATLSEPTREQLRARRNRILDQLEEEERNAELAEEQREQREEQERKDAAAQKRLEQDRGAAAAAEKAKAARELQKKMGRALIQNVGKAREQEKAEQEAQRLRDEEADRRRASPNIKKKSVAFVDSPEAKLRDADNNPADNESASSSKMMDWGDLAPGRLRSNANKRPTLSTQSLMDKHPMKMNVVERIPGGTPTIAAKQKLPSTPITTHRPVDSDDESDLGDEEEEEKPSDDSDTEVDQENDGDDGGDVALDQDAVDLDYAQLQREIAFEYYQKRNQIGRDAADAMMNHTHDEDERIPTEPEVLNDSSKPAISQFRANKLAAAFNVDVSQQASSPSSSPSASTSLGASVLPASSTRTIQKAIRTGKIDDDGKLVGGDADSASEDEDGGLQEVLELLRKGEVYNLGPNGEYVHAVRPNPNAGVKPESGTSAGASIVASSSSSAQPTATATASAPPPSARSKVSKFKADRNAAGRPQPAPSSVPIPVANPPSLQTLDRIRSPSVTPISHAGRSSPKLETPSTPVPAPAPVSVPAASTSTAATPTIRSPVPSRPAPQVQPPVSSAPSFSMIVESPSFPNMNRAGGSRAREHEHPYDTQLAAINAETTPGSSGRAGAGGQPRRLQRPPTVIASTVLERKPPANRGPSQSGVVGTEDTPQPAKKVSRFMAQRQ